MATAFTHVFVGAAIASLPRTAVSRPKLCLAAGLLAAAPDLDVLGFGLGIPYGHPLGHRGLTHAVAFALAVGPLAALALAPLRPMRGFLPVAGVMTAALASHGVLDALTHGGRGVGFLIPFDDARYFLPWRPLPASPLSVTAFFRGPGAAIFVQELLLIWLPALLGLAWWHRRGIRKP